MQSSNRWKAAANLNLLLGADHPPARVVRDPTSLTDTIEARSCVSFRDTLYCNRQDSNFSGTQQRLRDYYRSMLSRIPLWQHSVGVFKPLDENESPPPAVKEEPMDEAEEEAQGAAARNGHALAAPQYRALGILSQMNDPSAIGDDLLLPWEFFPITDATDDDIFVEAICSLTKEAAPLGGLLNAESANEEDAAAAGASALTASHTDSRRGPKRLSLYTRLVPQFTGLYPGMVVGVVGEPFKRSSAGVLTGVLVRQFVLPARPVFPWSIDRPLVGNVDKSTSVPTRVHFCSGPFPRREINSILSSVTHKALERGADLLIIGGPLIKEYEEFEKDILASMQVTFDELLNSYVDIIEDTINEYYTTAGNNRLRYRMKVIMVPHRNDITQIPVIPTTIYSLSDDEHVWLRSNPCRVAVNGVHFGVCNEDVVGDMRDRMVERWPAEEGSLRRVVETIVQSRLYAPVFELPAVKHEMRHLDALRMDLLPGRPTDVTQERLDSWDMFLRPSPKEEVEREEKRFKRETDDSSFSHHMRRNDDLVVECMPHIMFLPSTRPKFAIVTHRGVRDPASGQVQDESDLDNIAAASGVLVVNQEIWSRRSAPKFDLRVMEVTIPDSELVVRRGASEANGVSCGVLHFTSIE